MLGKKLKNPNFVSGIFLLRLELLIGAILVSFLGYFIDYIGIKGYSLEKGIWVSSLYISIILLSFLSSWVKHRIKYFLLSVYVFSHLLVIFISYKHGFSSQHYYSLLLIYLFFSFVQEKVRFYLIFNAIVSTALVFALVASTSLTSNQGLIYILAFLLVFLIGLSVTFSRENSKKKLLSRKNLLNYIFNNASDGLILVNQKDQTVEDCNNRLLAIFRISERKELIGKRLSEISLSGQALFNSDLEEGQSIVTKLNDNRVLKYKVKAFEFLQKGYWLIDLKQYQNHDEYSLSEEYDMLIKTSEDNYKYLFEESSSLICIISKEGKILDVNTTLLNTLGYTKDELVGQTFSYMDAEPYPQRSLVNQKAIDGEKQEFEKTILNKAGEEVEIEVILRNGKYFGEEVLISNSRDISKRKILEKEVQYNIYRYRTLFEFSPISIVIVDEGLQIVDYNTSFLTLFGYSAKELKGKRVRDFSHPDDFNLNDKSISLLDSGKSDVAETEKRYITKDGRTIHVILKISRLEDPENNVHGYVGHMVDITEIKDFQEQLEISEKSYRELFNNSYDLLYILDKNYKFIDVNKAVLEKYGIDREEIIGNSPVIFAAPDRNDMEKTVQIMNLAMEGEEQNLLWWSKKRNGEVFPKDLNLKRGIYKGETVLMATGRDISESYNYEKQLKEKERRFRHLFERNLAGVYRTQKDGILVESNIAFAKILGYDSVEEIKNKVNATNFYVDKNERINLLKKLEENKNVRGEKIQLKRSDGAAITALLNVSLIEDEKGEFKYFEGSLIDITDLDEAQKMLHESQEKYRKLIDNSSFGIFILWKGEIIFSNDKAAQILRYTSKVEMEGKNINNVFIEKGNEGFYSKLLHLDKGSDLAFREIKMLNADGKKIDAEVKPAQFTFENKDCVLLSFIDITDRKKIEKERERVRSVETFNKILQAELKEKERAQKRLVEAQSYAEGIIESSIDMIFTTDINGNINRLNSAAQKELKVDDSYLNQKVDILFADKSDSQAMTKSLKEKNSFSAEVNLKRSDKSIFPAYLSMSYLNNSDDTVLGIMGVSRNITDIKSKEIEIKAQAAKLNAIIESSSHFFFTVDKNYLITSFNQGFKSDVINNLDTDVEVGTHFFDLFPKYLIEEGVDLKSYWTEKFQAAFRGESVHFELERKDPQGQIYFRELYLNPIHTESGEVLEISGIGHDITDKKVSEESLKDSLNEKEVLLKEVHHRVKNNMQVISSILSLQSAYVQDESILNILRESQNRIKSMAFIHERLYRTKDFSKIKFSEYFKKLAENLIETYELSSNEIELKSDIEELYLNLDTAIPCGLIINELISNSLKYAFEPEEEGLITISLKQESNNVKLIIADNGKGIDEEVDFRNTESLGLQLVNTLVEQLEGKIELERDNGTKFTIIFANQEELKDVQKENINR
ncbi:MAG: PAS domain S-box protein [Vicingaceae bacterium]